MNQLQGSTEMEATPGLHTQTGNAISVISEVVTAEAHPPGVLEVETTVELSITRRFAITCLILLCNLIQFTSMFSTFAGGYEFSRRLGVDVAPGKSNWMAAAYGLTQSAFVLISGRLGAIYGHQRLLLVGALIVVFSICNAFCTTSVRALTGMGGGILMPNAVAALTNMIPPGKARNFSLATFAASPPIGALIGTLVVGTIFEHTDWKWFFILV
ncbi:MFS general substrate transporter [Aspergillus ellipticus CBS 707.79]|uniref:MFS general substrate transporter n=1 Tax=Aspergillus ellipticus CBS 707.79 TaxID=1448320 RepID=A0A319DTP1_9EURO|nr:MFS general substrate transporter [Aspergillus ellipticus CBS 707.79]